MRRRYPPPWTINEHNDACFIGARSMPADRRFPPPWTTDEANACFAARN